VVVRPGASLYAYGGSIGGPLATANAVAVVLVGTTVEGPLSVSGTTGDVGVEAAQIGGSAFLGGSAVPAAPILADSAVGGSLSCSGNQPAPVNNGFGNHVRGPSAGQCQGL